MTLARDLAHMDLTPHQSYIANTPLWPQYPTVTRLAIKAELEREAAARVRVHGDWVKTGKLTQAEADYQAKCWAALQEDIARQLTGPGTDPRNPWRHAPARHGVAWTARRAALARERDYRARLYPGWVAKGNLTQDQATHREDCLRALLDLYDQGFDWPGDREDWRAHWASITASTPANQQEMAL